MAELYFKHGAMNCGKTTHLLQSAHNYEARGMKILVIKPKVDTKGGTKIVSRLGIERETDHQVDKDEDLYAWLEPRLEDISCVFVDEAQFLTRENVNDLLKVAILNNIPVVCYGLRSDFNTNFFPGSLRLMEVATSTEVLRTICDCGKDAIFNTRRLAGEFVFEGDQVAIDGEGDVDYIALCPDCYMSAKEAFYRRRGKVYEKKRDQFR